MTEKRRNTVEWVRSSRCGNNACVEVVSVHEGTEVLIGDSKDPNEETLTFTREEWVAFRDGVKNGDFDGI